MFSFFVVDAVGGHAYLARANPNNVFPISSDQFKHTSITWCSNYIIMDLHANYIIVGQHAFVDGQ